MTGTAFPVSASSAAAPSAASPRPTAVAVAVAGFATALAAGLAEGLLRAARGGDPAGLLPRLAIYALVGLAVWRMSAGGRGARLLLAAGIGVAGTASLVVEPLAILLSAQSLRDPFLALTPTGTVLLACRIVHLVAVAVAVPALFTPAARAWFARR